MGLKLGSVERESRPQEFKGKDKGLVLDLSFNLLGNIELKVCLGAMFSLSLSLYKSGYLNQ